MPNFEDMPRELRDMVYKEALVSDEPISFGNHGARPSTPRTALNSLAEYLPLTQVSRALRDEATPILFKLNTFAVLLSTQKSRALTTALSNLPSRKNRHLRNRALLALTSDPNLTGSLTYGDAAAALFARVARTQALSLIRTLTVSVENADSIPTWQLLEPLYATFTGPEKRKFFSPRDWHHHAVTLQCSQFDTAIFTVDFARRRVDRGPIVQAPSLDGTAFAGGGPRRPCRACKAMLRMWGSDYSAEGGKRLRREQLLKLVWYVLFNGEMTLEWEIELTVISKACEL
jgi:hypothetical protein